MVSLNRSFLYGIFVASFTWVVCLYLFWQLGQKEQLSAPYTNLPSYQGKSLVSDRLKSNAVNGRQKYATGDKSNVNNDGQTKIDKTDYRNEISKSYVNSELILKRLQPVLPLLNSSSDTDQELGELGMVKSLEDRKLKDEGYKVHAFNILISNRLSLYREIPDTRNKLCQNVTYPEDLATASIIICFYNEHLNTLLRSVHSILDRTPPALLKEIILVDDYSDAAGLNEEIRKYVADELDPNTVRLFKTERREGLIRARVYGARKATGDTLIFLDSHIEVNVDWIRPLLSRVKEDTRNVVMPVIDVVNSDTFSYTASPLVRGGFNWGLHFKWENLPTGTLSKDVDFIKPIKSPTMAGGLFAIDRKFFTEIGEYDAGMNIWGGENLEISFRIWMCGGRLEMMPCSRVGHVFRQRRPYGAPDGQDTMLYNSLRVAMVWMDKYKEYFLKHRKDAAKIKYGDISSRIQLRKDLKCHDFDWYVKNVYPELTLPTDNEERLKKKWAALEQDKFQPWHSRKRNYIRQYQIRLSNTSLCVQSVKDFKTKGGLLELKPCIRSKAQIWYETDKSEQVLAQLLCMQAAQPEPILYKCHEMGGDQEWKRKGENNSPIYNMAAGTCLGARKAIAGSILVMVLCNEPAFNKWDIIE